MSRRLKKDLCLNNKDIQSSSKQTDTTFSDSSVKNITLDNGMLTNKKIYIHYGKEKPDYRLEFALKRLNAVIVQFYDDIVNFVITTVQKKRLSKTITPLSTSKCVTSNQLVKGSRAGKLVNLVQQKAMYTPKLIPISDKDNAFLDHVAEKGIRILHVKSVWSWLREYHSLILEDDDDIYGDDNDGNETRDMNNKVKKINDPSLKIVDCTNQTRPNFHQNCHIPKHMFEETADVVICDNSDSVQPKTADSARDSIKKSVKDNKVISKRELFCECCDTYYTNLLSHMGSSIHQEFANNASIFKGIDQVVSNLSQFSDFLNIRLRKQSILSKRTSKRLIKSLSANDFKKEKLNAEKNQIKRKSSILTEVELPLMYCEVIEENESFEEILMMKDNTDIEDHVIITDVEGINIATVRQELSFVALHYEEIEEDKVGVVDVIESPVWASVDIQESIYNMAVVRREQTQCEYQWMYHGDTVEDFTVDSTRLNFKDSDVTDGDGISIVASVMNMAVKEPRKTIFVAPRPIITETKNEEFAIEISSDNGEEFVAIRPCKVMLHGLHSRPVLTAQNRTGPEAIVDLVEKCGDNQFNKLSKIGLQRPGMSLRGIDQFISDHFRSRYQIDVSGGRMGPIDENEREKVDESGARRILKRRAKTVARDSIYLITANHNN